jgi:hypothetical protein
MAGKQADLTSQVLSVYAGIAICVVLVLVASPLFLVGAVIFLAIRIFQAWRVSKGQLTRLGHAESLALYDTAKRLATVRDLPTADAFTDTLYGELLETIDGPPPVAAVASRLLEVSDALYAGEGLTLKTIPAPPEVPDLLVDARYQDAIRPLIEKLGTPDLLPLMKAAIGGCLSAIIDRLPPAAREPQDAEPAGVQFEIPLLDACSDIPSWLEPCAWPFYGADLKKTGLFADLRTQLDRNLNAASGGGGEQVAPARLVFPTDFDGTAAETVSAYFGHTPLADLFRATVPFAIPQASRLEHWHLVAGSGHGKTQTLQSIIAGDLTGADRPALVIIDSQGDMLRKIERLGLFDHNDHLIVIDPEDDWSPALNMFDVNRQRHHSYTRVVREQVEAGIIELFNYVFGALASDLTAKQGTAFAYITRLMLAIPGATIHTFRELMETNNPSRFAPAIATLDPTARAFFENQFFNKTAFGETRQQIARRLYTVLQVPAFERMFASPTNKLDMFGALQGRKVVLVNTAKSLLKTDASALFGRYMIALTMNAAFERVAVPEDERHPAYLVIDEAAEYFDGTLERLLAQARKFGLGVLFAHQHMDQLSPPLRSAVAANTSIKMAGGVSDHDARLLAPDMRTKPDFIAAARKHEASTEFVCAVRNHTDAAVRLAIPFGTLEAMPVMDAPAHQKLRWRNRTRYGTPPSDPASEPARDETPPPQQPRRNPDEVVMHATEF